MPLSRTIARFNKRIANPVMRTVAGRVPMLGLLVHRGRSSGSVYTTPVNVFLTADGVLIPVTYGRNSDWVQNVLAAGECDLVHRSRTLRLTTPRFADSADVHAYVPTVVRAALGVLDVEDFLLFTSLAPTPPQ
jgi:deazaflavin-dependent oxidoreductase (nitroreductase family)